jgi:tetratricopeptide (TPR) repeat protein
LFLAILLLDRGAKDAGQAELTALRRRHPHSLVLPELDRRLAGAEWSVALPLEPLPAASDAFDHFLLGYLLLRDRRVDGAQAELERALALEANLLPARDLQLLTLLGTRQWRKALAEAHTLEGIYGAPTARTRHTIAAALIMLGEPEPALAAAREADALRPGRHGPLQNMGVALFQLGRLDEALACFERAYDLRPELPNTYEMLARTYRELGRFDDALAVAERIPHAEGQGGRWRYDLEIGNNLTDQALLARNQRDVESAARLARRAQRSLRRALEQAPAFARSEVEASWFTAEALAEDKVLELVDRRLAAMRHAPRPAATGLRDVGHLLLWTGERRALALHFLFRAHHLMPRDLKTLTLLVGELLRDGEAAAAERVLADAFGKNDWSPADRQLAIRILPAVIDDACFVDLLLLFHRRQVFAADSPVPGTVLQRLERIAKVRTVPPELISYLDAPGSLPGASFKDVRK